MDISLLKQTLEKGAHNILFVCTGNICRSPVAEYLLRDELSRLHISNTAVKSAGLLELGPQPADPEMIEIGREHGVDLTAHRSRQISLEMVSEASVVFVMETRQKEKLSQFMPEYKDKILLLSLFDYVHYGLNIHDPLGKNRQIFNYCFSRIYKTAQKLALLVKETQP